MKNFAITALLAVVAMPSAPAVARSDRNTTESERHDNNRAEQNRIDRKHASNSNNGRHRGQKKRAAWQDYHRYDYNRYDPRYGNYRADRYYRDGGYYQDRRLSSRDRIYRGSNNRYYCRRSDGTTGLIIGAAGGGLLGRAIAPNGSKTLGTILGGAGGALIGRSIGRSGVRCN